MRLNLPTFILTAGLLILASQPQAKTSTNEIAWLAVGDFRGHLEPCGCDPDTDLGGIKRLSTLLKRERMLNPHLWFFHLGNSLEAQQLDLVKSKYILDGLGILRPTASLVNHIEIANRSFFEKPGYFERLNYLLSNFRQRSKKLPFKSLVRTDQLVVLGYLYSEQSREKVERFGDSLSKGWTAALARYQRLYKVLLFSGPDEDLGKIVEAKLFDQIISSNPRNLDTEVGKDERQNPRLFLVREIGNMMVSSVPLGGQGVLRGGQLVDHKARSVAELLANKRESRSEVPSLRAREGEPAVTWLDRSFEVGSTLDDLMKRYNTARKEEFARQARVREKFLASTAFVGAESCAGCHAQAYEVWKKSKHASAYETLVSKNKHQDSSCVNCHVLAFEKAGGFVSSQSTPHFANVQCENCHGARLEHVKNPRLTTANVRTAEAKDICASCHHSPHSPNFDYQKYWSLIEHK